MAQSGYFSMIKDNFAQIILMIAILLFSATAIGVQRTLLTVFTQELDESFSTYIILGSAIALSVFGVFKAIGNFLGGNYSDKLGRLLSIRAGLIILLLGSFIILLANNLWIFFIANSIIGIGVGVLLSSSTVVFTDVATQENRAKSISLMELSVYSGTSFGSIFTGYVAEIDLLLPFIIALLSVLLSVLLSIFLRETRDKVKDEQKDQMQKRKHNIQELRTDWIEFSSKYDFLASEEVEDLFYRLKQTKTQHYKKREFRYKQILHPSVLLTFNTGLVSRISDAAVIIILPLLILSRGFSALELGLFTSTFTITWAFGMLVSGKLADGIGRKFPIILGLTLEFLGISLLFLPGLKNQVTFTLITLIIAGLGRGIYYPIPSSIISDLIIPEKRGQVLGIYRFVLDFGYVIGAFMLVVLVELPFDNGVENIALFQSSFVAVLMLLGIQILLTTLLLKDPRPNFKQMELLNDHSTKIKSAINLLSLALFEKGAGKVIESQLLVDQAKEVEKQADRILETLVEDTYSGALEAVDALEMINFAQKMDKALGHTLRSVRKLLLIKEIMSEQFYQKVCSFAIMLDILVQEAVETIALVPVQISLASQQSYRVNRAEIILDEIHQNLFTSIIEQDYEQNSTSVLLIQTIESLEKAANTVEDAVQLIRLVALKHNV